MNTTFTPFRSARWLLLFLLLSFSGSLDAWAHAYSPASYDAGNGSLPVTVAGDSKPALVPATQRFKGGSTVVADVVSLNRFTPLDQIIDPARWPSVKYEVRLAEGTRGDGFKFRLTTTGTASGTITGASFTDRLPNTGYVTVGEISGVGTIRLDYQMDSGEWFAGQTYDIVDLKPTFLGFARLNPGFDSLSLLGRPFNGDAEFLVNFSEPITGLDVADFNLVLNGNVHTTIVGLSRPSGLGGLANANPNGWIVILGDMQGVGSIGVELKPDATVTDTQGNALGGFSTGPIYRYDGVEPFVTSIKRSDPASTVAVPGTVTYRVTFSEAVQGVDASDFGFDATGSVAGYSISTITPVSASVYDVTVTSITGQGTLRLKLWPGFTENDYYFHSDVGLLNSTPLENVIDGMTALNGGVAIIFDFSNGTPIPSPSTYVSSIPFASDPLYTYDNPLKREFIDGETYTISSTPVVASINPATAGLSCTTPSVRLTASAGTAYLWSTGATTAAIDVTVAGTYSVTITNNSVTSVTSAEVTGSTQAPVASINPGSATLNCTTPSVVLTASGGESYRWDDNSTNATRSVSTAGTYSVTVTGANSCTATAQTTVNGNATVGQMTYYADADGDGFGNPNSLTTVCASTPPAGYVTNKLDCDDTRRLYADGDGDGFGAGPAVACGVANNTDCNDSMMMYADADGDGFGSTTKVACNGVATNTDCNDNLVQYVDTDNDGFGSTTKVACNGVANNTDCDDTRKLYADGDKDGFGAGPAVACGVATNTDCDDNNAAIIPTIITAQPKSLAIEEKQDVTFSVTATGTNLIYQWYVNGTNPANELKKETSATLTLKSVKASDGWTYYVRVTGACGSVLSTGARLTVSSKKARLAAPEPISPLLVTVLGNPLVGTQLEVAVKGAEGVPLQFEVIDLGGRVITQQHVEQAGAVETRRLELGAQSAGMLLLRVSTPTQSRTLRVLKVD